MVSFYKYNSLPEGISKEEFELCINCPYRLRNLEVEINEFYNKRYGILGFEKKERKDSLSIKCECDRVSCLIDGIELKRLLNENSLDRVKEGE